MSEQNKFTSITINDVSIILNMLSVAIDRGAYVENEVNLVRNLRDKLNQFVSMALVMQAHAQAELETNTTTEKSMQEVEQTPVKETKSENAAPANKSRTRKKN